MGGFFVLGVVWCQKAQNDGSLPPWVLSPSLAASRPEAAGFVVYVTPVFPLFRLECRSVKRSEFLDFVMICRELESGGRLAGTLFWGYVMAFPWSGSDWSEVGGGQPTKNNNNGKRLFACRVVFVLTVLQLSLSASLREKAIGMGGWDRWATGARDDGLGPNGVRSPRSTTLNPCNTSISSKWHHAATD